VNTTQIIMFVNIRLFGRNKQTNGNVT